MSPQCRCGRQIQSGRRCSECERDDRLGQGLGRPTHDATESESSTVLECGGCDREYWRDEGPPCPFCESYQRSPADGTTPPMITTEDDAVVAVHGPDPTLYDQQWGGSP